MKFLLYLLGIFQLLHVEKEKMILELKPLEILKIIHFDISTLLWFIKIGNPSNRFPIFMNHNKNSTLFINRDTFNTKLGCIFSFLFWTKRWIFVFKFQDDTKRAKSSQRKFAWP